MAIDKKIVEYVAHLSRIDLDPAELDKISSQLGDILDFIDQLKNADITGVSPTSHILPLKDVLRPDEPADSLPVSKALENAPDKQESFFRVPKVIE